MPNKDEPSDDHDAAPADLDCKDDALDDDSSWDGESVPSAKESYLWQRFNTQVPIVARALKDELESFGATLLQLFLDPFSVSDILARHPMPDDADRFDSERPIEPDSYSDFQRGRHRVERLFMPDR